MSSINVCERCEAFGLGLAMGRIDFRTDPTKAMQSKDICPDCVSELLAFMDESPERDKKRVHKLPYAAGPTQSETLTEDVLRLAKKILDQKALEAH